MREITCSLVKPNQIIPPLRIVGSRWLMLPSLRSRLLLLQAHWGSLWVYPFRLIWHHTHCERGRRCTLQPSALRSLPPAARFGLGSHTCPVFLSWGLTIRSCTAVPLSVYSLVRVKIPTIHHLLPRPSLVQTSSKTRLPVHRQNVKRPVNSADSQPRDSLLSRLLVRFFFV